MTLTQALTTRPDDKRFAAQKCGRQGPATWLIGDCALARQELLVQCRGWLRECDRALSNQPILRDALIISVSLRRVVLPQMVRRCPRQPQIASPKGRDTAFGEADGGFRVPDHRLAV